MNIRDDDVSVPDLTEAQINALEQLFPEQSADLRWTDREIWFKAGARSVVRFLRDQFDIQHTTEYEDHVSPEST